MRELIGSHPTILMGKPVVRGTRITVESLVERVGANESIEALRASGDEVMYGAEG